MSQEKLNHVVVGVLFDFMGWLTSRKEKLTLSSSNDAALAVGAIDNFLKLRGIEESEPLQQWADRCNKIKRGVKKVNKSHTEAGRLTREAMADLSLVLGRDGEDISYFYPAELDDIARKLMLNGYWGNGEEP